MKQDYLMVPSSQGASPECIAGGTKCPILCASTENDISYPITELRPKLPAVCVAPLSESASINTRVMSVL